MKTNLLGTKIGMTQIYDGENRLIPVTVIQAGPCSVTQVKTFSRDGYDAIQLGYEDQKDHRLTKPIKGHLKKSGVSGKKNLQEVRVIDASTFSLGEVFTVDLFEEGEKVDVISKTKGRGFQGVVKRWNFSGGKNSHGHMMHRRPGSIGQCQWPGEVDKGRKMPGHMGNKRRTVQALKIIKIDKEQNLILVKGSLPGSNGSLVTIRPTKKIKGRKLSL